MDSSPILKTYTDEPYTLLEQERIKLALRAWWGDLPAYGSIENSLGLSAAMRRAIRNDYLRQAVDVLSEGLDNIPKSGIVGFGNQQV